MFERFTAASREVVVLAEAAAREMGGDTIEATHLLLALVEETHGVGGQVLREGGLSADQVRAALRTRAGAGDLDAEDAEALRHIGIDLSVVMRRLEESLGPDPVPRPAPRRGRARFSRNAKKCLQLALREAVWLKSREIGSEHVLLGLLRCEDPDVVEVLTGLGADPEELHRMTLRRTGRAA